MECREVKEATNVSSPSVLTGRQAGGRLSYTDCGLTSSYTNRENRLARQMLDHIRTQTKWTSGVDRPFVLGI